MTATFNKRTLYKIAGVILILSGIYYYVPAFAITAFGSIGSSLIAISVGAWFLILGFKKK